jgi:putative ABC transport system ATP-binding protein
MDTILKVENLSQSFSTENETNTVLHNINTSFQTNALTMIIGPSGCGKTTLLSNITGILTPTKGKIFINNTDIYALSNTERTLLRQKDIGFIFQQFNLLEKISVIENVSIPLIAQGLTLNEAAELALSTLEKLGIKKHADKLPTALSGGEQQRVAIARALIHDPQIIVCDEPTAALDEKTGHNIMKILSRVATSPKRAVIIVTHDSRIFHYADSIIELNDGKIINTQHNQRPKIA